MIKLQIIKRLKLLFIREEMIDFVISLNNNYDTVEEYCKKKEWKVFDNIHKTLNVVECEKGKETGSNLNQDWLNERAVDIALKSFIVISK